MRPTAKNKDMPFGTMGCGGCAAKGAGSAPAGAIWTGQAETSSGHGSGIERERSNRATVDRHKGQSGRNLLVKEAEVSIFKETWAIPEWRLSGNIRLGDARFGSSRRGYSQLQKTSPHNHQSPF